VFSDKINSLCRAVTCPHSVNSKGEETAGKKEKARKMGRQKKAKKKPDETICLYFALPTYKCS